MSSADEVTAKMSDVATAMKTGHSTEDIAKMVGKLRDDVGIKEEDKPDARKSMSGNIVVNKMWKEGRAVTLEEMDEEEITIPVPAKDVPMCQVGFTTSMTLNLGDFESVKMGITANVPCYVEEMPDAYLAAKKFMDARLNAEIAAVRKYREGKGKPS